MEEGIKLNVYESSKRYEQILDTEFYYGIPYNIDVEKYKTTVNSFHDCRNERMATQLSDERIKTLSLSCVWNEKIANYGIWLHSNVRGDKNDIRTIDIYNFEGVSKEYFNQCIVDITKCFVEINEKLLKETKDILKNSIVETEKAIKFIEGLGF